MYTYIFIWKSKVYPAAKEVEYVGPVNSAAGTKPLTL